jgi:DNA-binding transcriptional ArsR family regulator
MHAVADPFQTLADPSRRRVVEALLRGERAVNDLVAELDLAQPGVSRHLRILLEAGFVRVRPDGQRRLYSLAPGPFQELDAWLARYRALWEGRLDRLEQALLARRAVAGSGEVRPRVGPSASGPGPAAKASRASHRASASTSVSVNTSANASTARRSPPRKPATRRPEKVR